MKRISLFSIICLGLFISLISFSDDSNPGLVTGVLNQTNQFRKSNGLPELMINKELNAIAQKHSDDMASGRVAFGHAGFEKRNAKASKAIKGLHSFAENVAYGAATAEEVVTMWKNSAGHRRNMLGQYTYTGIGIATDRKGRIYYTEIFGGTN